RTENSRFNYSEIKGYKESSVLVLIFPQNGSAYIPLIKRPDYDGIHSGQISLPGGKREVQDKNLVDTALRETWEEIGAQINQIKILGSLTPLYIPPSNFMVNPFVGFVESKPQFKIDPVEVQKIIEAPVSYFVEGNNVLNKEIEIIRKSGKANEVIKLETPYFDLEGEVLWGATAMILSELKELMR
ncbi:MAG TPA: CoA pyrophosphatase, partial [Cyclobacteriaceae bacterium]